MLGSVSYAYDLCQTHIIILNPQVQKINIVAGLALACCWLKCPPSQGEVIKLLTVIDLVPYTGHHSQSRAPYDMQLVSLDLFT